MTAGHAIIARQRPSCPAQVITAERITGAHAARHVRRSRRLLLDSRRLVDSHRQILRHVHAAIHVERMAGDVAGLL